MTFINTASTISNVDRPLFAGITNDLWRNNTEWTMKKAVWHLDSSPIEGVWSCLRESKNNGEWQGYSTIYPMLVPIRPVPDGYVRKYEIELKLSHNLPVEQNAHVRCYLLDAGGWAPFGTTATYTDATLPSTDAYCEFDLGSHESGDAGYEAQDIDTSTFDAVPIGPALAPTALLWTDPGINVGKLVFFVSTSAACVVQIDSIIAREWVDTE